MEDSTNIWLLAVCERARARERERARERRRERDQGHKEAQKGMLEERRTLRVDEVLEVEVGGHDAHGLGIPLPCRPLCSQV